MKRLPAILLLLAAGCQLCRAAGARWELKFFHDAIDSELAIHDLAFPSERTGVAAGVLLEKGNAKPRVLVTRDGHEVLTNVPKQFEDAVIGPM